MTGGRGSGRGTGKGCGGQFGSISTLSAPKVSGTVGSGKSYTLYTVVCNNNVRS